MTLSFVIYRTLGLEGWADKTQVTELRVPAAEGRDIYLLPTACLALPHYPLMLAFSLLAYIPWLLDPASSHTDDLVRSSSTSAIMLGRDE